MTGCQKNNLLNKQRNDLKFWLDSKNYNHIEIIHHLMLLSVVDKIISVKNWFYWGSNEKGIKFLKGVDIVLHAAWGGMGLTENHIFVLSKLQQKNCNNELI